MVSPARIAEVDWLATEMAHCYPLVVVHVWLDALVVEPPRLDQGLQSCSQEDVMLIHASWRLVVALALQPVLDSMTHIWFLSWSFLDVVVGGGLSSYCDCSALCGSGFDDSHHFEVDRGVNLVGNGGGPIGDGWELPACVVVGLPSLAGLLSFDLERTPLAMADLSLF